MSNGYSNLTVTATDGNPFNLMGLDLGISFYNNNVTDTVTLTAFLHGGGTMTDALTIGRNFASYSFNLTGLDSFVISMPANRGYVAVDNIRFSEFSEVPEPTSIALIGLALLGLGVSRKRSMKY